MKRRREIVNKTVQKCAVRKRSDDNSARENKATAGVNSLDISNRDESISNLISLSLDISTRDNSLDISTRDISLDNSASDNSMSISSRDNSISDISVSYSGVSSSIKTGDSSSSFLRASNHIKYHPVSLTKNQPTYTTQSPFSTAVLFKVDLRISDNPALYFASKHANDQPGTNLIGLFVWCEKEWRIHNYGDYKIALLTEALNSLKRELLEKYHIPLVILNVDEPADIPQVICIFCRELSINAVFYNKQYEYDEMQRDLLMQTGLSECLGISCFSFDEQCAVIPGTCKTQQGLQYTVFTPFKKCWLRILQETDKHLLTELPAPSPNNSDILQALKNNTKQLQKKLCPSLAPIDAAIRNLLPDHFELLPCISFDSSSLAMDLYLSNEQQVTEAADRFISQRASTYHTARDFPAINGTSQLSPYLALGMLSIRTLLCKVLQKNHSLSTGNEGLVCWVSELCWRDFYRHILVAFPHVCKSKPFKLSAERISWSNNVEHFHAWTQGLTGFPIVDAAMRQLNATGWMHNRLRMIAAMFLVKDLLVNWQWGERYFSDHLVDADFASNNGGWQWSASTGTDAQPYFRVFNPTLQSQRFDPQGEFICKWLPELSSLKSTAAIHNPYALLSEFKFSQLQYPKPLVEHSKARDAAIAEYKRVYSQ